MTTYIEFLGTTDYYLAMGLKIFVAILVGTLVGIDREKKFKSAGVKTNILICLGAALYTAISLEMQNLVGHTDPTRIAAQIVSGIGFLGGGSIIQSKGQVQGLTTAATIWVIAAIGAVIGFGLVFSALFFGITVLVVLKFIDPIINLQEKVKLKRNYQIHIQSVGSISDFIRKILDFHKSEYIQFEEFTHPQHETLVYLEVKIKCYPSDFEKIIQDINFHMLVDKINYRRLEKSHI